MQTTRTNVDQALVIVHLSSLDNYTVEFGREQGQIMADEIYGALEQHAGPIVIIDQNWTLQGSNSRPRRSVYDGIQQLPDEQLITIQHDENETDWADLFDRLIPLLSRLCVKTVRIGGFWYDPEEKTGCAWYVGQQLMDKFKVIYDSDILASFEDEDEDEDEDEEEQGVVQKNPNPGPQLALNPKGSHLEALHAFAISHHAQLRQLIGAHVDFDHPLGEGTSAIAYPAGAAVLKVTYDYTEGAAAQAILADDELNRHPGVLRVFAVWPLGTMQGEDWCGQPAQYNIHALHVERLLPFESVVTVPHEQQWVEQVLQEYRSAIEYGGDVEGLVDDVGSYGPLSEVADFMRLIHERTDRWPEDIWEGNLGGRNDGGLALLDLGALHLGLSLKNPHGPQLDLDLEEPPTPPVTLYHGTTRRAARKIKQVGMLIPMIGSFVEEAYGGEYAGFSEEEIEQELGGVVFAAGFENIDSAITAMISHIASDRGKSFHDVTRQDIEKYGALVLFEIEDPDEDIVEGADQYGSPVDTWVHRPEDDENYYGQYPSSVEHGDYFFKCDSYDGVGFDEILTGKKLVQFLAGASFWYMEHVK